MTNQKPRDDLSTEQIMQSIGRIVAEGEDRAPLRGDAAPPAAAPAWGDDVLDLVDAVDERGDPLPPERAFEGVPAVSSPAPADAPAARVAAGGRTPEAQVLEALRPMLQTWLDTHMPPIVERLVRREIERAQRRSEPE
jgi:cell pole-organizing protein PopZ